MKKTIYCILFILFYFNKTSVAQVSVNLNFGINSDFVGWDNSMTDPLMIKHENGGTDARIEFWEFKII